MEYTKDTTVGDVTTYERYEGTPEEIARLVMLLPQELNGGELGQGFKITEDDYIFPSDVEEILIKDPNGELVIHVVKGIQDVIINENYNIVIRNAGENMSTVAESISKIKY